MRKDMEHLIADMGQHKHDEQHDRFHRAHIRDTLKKARNYNFRDEDHISLDLLHKRNSMKAHKVLDRYLEDGYYSNPLDRFLESQVGRPWNDVYSDIKASIGKGTQAYRILNLVHWRVLHGKAPHWYYDLYVDADGILRNTRSERPQKTISNTKKNSIKHKELARARKKRMEARKALYELSDSEFRACLRSLEYRQESYRGFVKRYYALNNTYPFYGWYTYRWRQRQYEHEDM